MYKSLNHSTFLLKYHIIFVVKYRKKLLDNIKISDFLKQEITKISDNSNFNIDIMEVDKDHIHLLVDSEPKISPLSIVRKLKQMTTILLWNKFPVYLGKHFWKERTFWTDGYFVCSCGDASAETIMNYIKNQG